MRVKVTPTTYRYVEKAKRTGNRSAEVDAYELILRDVKRDLESDEETLDPGLVKVQAYAGHILESCDSGGRNLSRPGIWIESAAC